jgi:hypothetical protein
MFVFCFFNPSSKLKKFEKQIKMFTKTTNPTVLNYSIIRPFKNPIMIKIRPDGVETKIKNNPFEHLETGGFGSKTGGFGSKTGGFGSKSTSSRSSGGFGSKTGGFGSKTTSRRYFSNFGNKTGGFGSKSTSSRNSGGFGSKTGLTSSRSSEFEIELNQLEKFVNTWCDVDLRRGLRDWSDEKEQQEIYIQPLGAFKREYKNFCQREVLPTPHCTYASFTINLGRLNVKLLNQHPWKPDQSGKFIVGLRLKPETTERLQMGKQPFVAPKLENNKSKTCNCT